MVDISAASLFSLQGRTAVLTGATGFLGRTFARALLGNGARLVAIGRSQRLESAATQWARDYGRERVRIEQLDMYDLPRFTATLDRLAEEETVDVLVNNAFDFSPRTGFNDPTGSLESQSFDQWSSCLTGGIYWPALAIQRLGGSMKERRRGSIVNIATMYAEVAPNPRLYHNTRFMNPPGYSAAKAGLMALTRYTASFWGPYSIRCNAILPGPFSNTDDSTANSVSADDPFIVRLRERTVLGRIGSPRELAGALLFLASDASTFVTGHGLVVDGGWTIT